MKPFQKMISGRSWECSMCHRKNCNYWDAEQTNEKLGRKAVKDGAKICLKCFDFLAEQG